LDVRNYLASFFLLLQEKLVILLYKKIGVKYFY